MNSYAFVITALLLPWCVVAYLLHALPRWRISVSKEILQRRLAITCFIAFAIQMQSLVILLTPSSMFDPNLSLAIFEGLGQLQVGLENQLGAPAALPLGVATIAFGLLVNSYLFMLPNIRLKGSAAPRSSPVK